MKPPPVPPPEKIPEILLVDGNRHGLIVRRSLLQELGYHVRISTSGEEALELCSQHAVDVIVTDYKMARMNGPELIRRIRANKADARIILLSGLVEPLGLTEQTTGADTVIPKSANEVRHLTLAVKRLLSRPPVRKPPAAAAPAAPLKKFKAKA